MTHTLHRCLCSSLQGKKERLSVSCGNIAPKSLQIGRYKNDEREEDDYLRGERGGLGGGA